MIAIIVIIIALAMMAKGKPRRGWRNARYIRGNVDEELALTALASKDVVGAVFDETVNERTLVSSLVATWTMENFTVGAGIGPIVVGVAHGDYSDAEIEEWLESTGQWNEGNLVAREIGARKIRQVGTFPAAEGGGIGAVNLALGRAIKTRLNWILLQGQTLRIWAYNAGSQPVATTVPSVTINGHANLWPK